MKLSRTKEYNFGWLVVFPLIDVVFLLIFFLLLSSNFVLQPGIAVSAPASPFLLGAQQNQQIISITGRAVPAIYFRGPRCRFLSLPSCLSVHRFAYPSAAAGEFNQCKFRTRSHAPSLDRR